jgi:hypothetical protein
VGVGSLGQRGGGQRVVLDRLDRMRLHERHVLEGRGVDDDLRGVFREQAIDPLGIGHVAQDRFDADGSIGMRERELPVDGEEGALRPFHEEQPGGLEPHQLAADLRADRASRTGHEHRAVVEEGMHVGVVIRQPRLEAGEEVGQFDVAHPWCRRCVGERGDLHPHAAIVAGVAQAPEPCAEDRTLEHDDLGRPQPTGPCRCVADRPPDRRRLPGRRVCARPLPQPAHAPFGSRLTAVERVVEQARHDIAAAVRVRHGAERRGEGLPCRRGIDDEHGSPLALAGRGRDPPAQPTRSDLHATHDQEREDPVEQQHREWHRRPPGSLSGDRVERGEQDEGGAARRDEPADIAPGRGPPWPVAQPPPIKDGHFQAEDDDDRSQPDRRWCRLQQHHAADEDRRQPGHLKEQGEHGRHDHGPAGGTPRAPPARQRKPVERSCRVC